MLKWKHGSKNAAKNAHRKTSWRPFSGPRRPGLTSALETYYEHIAPDYAAVFVKGALEATQRLERFPRSGRIVPEIMDPMFRELIYRGYRIIYLVDDTRDTVEVMTVFHAARQFGGLKLEDDE